MATARWRVVLLAIFQLACLLLVAGSEGVAAAGGSNVVEPRAPKVEIIGGAGHIELKSVNVAKAGSNVASTNPLGGGGGLPIRGGLKKRVSVSTVALLTLLMAVATGLGAVPFFFFEIQQSWQGICNGIACGVMLAASFDLVVEGQVHGGGGCVVLGILLGGLFILVSQKVLDRFGDVKMMELRGADAKRMVLIVAIMTLHSFGEGSGVGVSFAGPRGFPQGLLVTIAIAVHNVPEGLAVCMVMASRGVAPRHAMLWSIFTSLPQPLVAIPAFLCAETFIDFLPVCVGFAAGCMIWIVFGEVMPDCLKEANTTHVASAATISVALMEGVGTLLQGLEEPPSWDRVAPALWSLLFVLGPLLGGGLLVLVREVLPLHPTLLSGLAAGMMLVLATWRPLHLWFNAKMGFFSLLGLLYAGAFLYLAASHLSKGRCLSQRQLDGGGGGQVAGALRHSKAPAVSPLSLATALACGTVVFHALTEGLMLGVAAPHAEGLGMYMLLPVALHGLPRGIAVASAMFGVSKSWRGAMTAAAFVGFAGPAGAWGAMAAGLSNRGLDTWMVLACGCMIPAAASELLPRAVTLNRKRTLAGLGLGASFVLVGLSATRVLCLSTPYCNSAPEAVT